MSIANQEMIRNNNRRLVLEFIINNPPVSRAALAKQLSLTKATISNIVQELLEQHLIREIGSAQTSMGRKPILLEFNKSYGFALSLEIQPHQIIALVTNLKGEIQQTQKLPFRSQDNLLQYLEQILNFYIRENTVFKNKIIGVSIGIYGVVQKNEILFTPYYPLPDSGLGTYLQETFQIPVFVENEANLSVLGEAAFHHKYKNMIHINVHDGIGMGILVNGQLYKGRDGYAGEFGHTILFPDGKPCPCGNHGCFELYASQRAILENYAARQKKETVTISEFLKDYDASLPLANEMMDLFVKYISIGINNIINTFNTDIIVLNSAFSNHIPDINQRILGYLARHQNRDCSIISSKLGTFSCLLGGARMSIESFLNIHHLQISCPSSF
ncbi:MAG: ROK family transcriptional regulator [Bacillota bacterium]|nr:ROK family transcriptional regulator [Bacillota bacterium]